MVENFEKKVEIRQLFQLKSTGIFLIFPLKHMFWVLITHNICFHGEVICCGYSLEAPWHGASDEYPQHMFSWRNKKKNYLDTLSLIWSYDISTVKPH